jgi:hypothetical protein
VDKLVKVWLKSGEEKWLLIHIEVQAEREGDFPKRMYVYNYRIFDRYDREVISLAILADDDPNWRPGQYGYGRWGFRTSIEFPVVKLLDYASQAWKVRLVKGLYDRGMSAEDVRQLYRFIDWIMALPEPLERLFWQEITQYQEEKRMPFVTIAERVGMEKGLEKGLLKGIEVSLKVKFGAEGLALLPEIRALQDHELLEAVLEAIEAAANPDELRRVWAPKRRPRKGRRL